MVKQPFLTALAVVAVTGGLAWALHYALEARFRRGFIHAIDLIALDGNDWDWEA